MTTRLRNERRVIQLDQGKKNRHKMIITIYKLKFMMEIKLEVSSERHTKLGIEQKTIPRRILIRIKEKENSRG